MPILYNPYKNSVSILLHDGSMRSIGGKQRFYVSPNDLSGHILEMIDKKLLLNKGGDPVETVEMVTNTEKEDLTVTPDTGVTITITPATSSDIHQDRDIDSDIKDLEDQINTEVSVKLVNRKKKKKDLEE